MPLARLGALVALLVTIVSAPVAVGDPRTGWVTLEWTAPGDDSTLGSAALYDIRCSRRPITESNFGAAIQLRLLPAQPAGSHEICSVGALAVGVDYYFAIRTQDDAGNWSGISNLGLVRGRAIDSEPLPDPPGAIVRPAEFSSPFPNPARGSVRFDLSLPSAGPARVEVFDLTGRLVRLLVASIQSAGVNRVDWDLLDEGANRVVAGVYLVRAELEGLTRLRRVVVLK